MKSKFNFIVALACLLSSGLFLASCEKSSLKENEPQALQTSASSKTGDDDISETREYKLTDVTVELNDEGREQLIREGHSPIKQTGDLSYITIKNTPWDPYDPVICGGLTASQIWPDIMTKFNNFMNSPQGQAAKAYANSTCRPVPVCIDNCALAVMFLIQPDVRCAEYDVAHYVAASKLSAQFVEEAP
jgi:hypothetical protein